MIDQKIIEILENFACGRTTAGEQAFFNNWLSTADAKEFQFALDCYENILRHYQDDEQPDLQLANSIRERLISYNTAINRVNRRKKAIRIAAVAVVAGVLSCTAYLLLKQPPQPPVEINTAYKNDILPGTSKAMLTLSDGSRIDVGSATAGLVTHQGSILIKKDKNGQLLYDGSAPKMVGNAIKYNTITTPRTGHYQIVLADGSKIWLNAESSLKFPVSFEGSKRRVELQGEAYFEVAKRSDQPFVVISGRHTVEVLGTHFNVNVYPEEDGVKTTLVEGAVKIIKGDDAVLLKPGQQSVVPHSLNAKIKVNNKVDVEEVLAWKNGLFQFNDTDLRVIMRQLERWYDVDINYQEIPSTRFNGSLSRNVNLSKVLKMLELTGNIQFKIQGRRISVMR